MTANVITIKWGEIKFGSHYVNRLYSGVKRNLSHDFRFVCFTDNVTGITPEVETYPLPEVNPRAIAHFRNGKKQGLFKANIGDLKGPCLYFDLDVIIVDSIDCFFEFNPSRFCICKEWLAPHKVIRNSVLGRKRGGNSSVFRFEANSMQYIVDMMNENPDLPRQFQLEQEWLSFAAGDKMTWWPDDWVASFKHRRPVYPISLFLPPVKPKNCRVMVFNGPLKPEDAIRGNFELSPRRVCRPTPWVAEHWR